MPTETTILGVNQDLVREMTRSMAQSLARLVVDMNREPLPAYLAVLDKAYTSGAMARMSDFDWYLDPEKAPGGADPC